MTTINFSNHFKSSLKKLARRQPEIIGTVIEKIIVFNNNIGDPSLRTHKLSGALKDHWAFSIEHDLRIIFLYSNDGNVLFVDIGSHDQVY